MNANDPTAGLNIYEVGGSVRDRLLGQPHEDRDWVVVGASAESMLSRGFTQVGQDFPVFLHPFSKEEYALARTERKNAPGHRGFQVHADPSVTLDKDLARRDLTINAMALTPGGNLIDPFNGAEDLRKGILRHVSPAFSEDPLRVLRLARFAAKFSFRIAEETRLLAQQISVSGELETLSPERVWQELYKALAGPSPSRFIEALREIHALGVLFPEIEALFGVPQTAVYHPEIDTGIHLLLSLDMATSLTDDPLVRFSVLVHDLGKGTTPREFWPRHIGHEARGVPLVNHLCRRYRLPKHYLWLGQNASRYHLQVHRAFELKPTTLLKLLKNLDAFRRPVDFQRFLLACEADARGRKGLQQQLYPQRAFLQEVHQAASEVDTGAIKLQGFQGEAFGREVQQHRLRAIQRLLDDEKSKGEPGS